MATNYLSKTTSINQTKQVHAKLITNGYKSPSIFAKLIKRYCTFSSSKQALNHAHQILAHFHEPNLYLLNTLIRCTLPKKAFRVFSKWASRNNRIFDDFTYIFALGACARSCSLSSLCEGKQMHTHIVKNGFLLNVLIPTTLIHFYARNKDIKSARKLFDEMPVRSSVSWNAMITAYCSQKTQANECARDAVLLFKGMLVEFREVKPTDTTMVCVLSAISQLGVLENGVCVHGYVQKTIFNPENDVFIGTALVDMYSKCGCINTALSIFWRMGEKNVLTWTAITSGLAIHGEGKHALNLLNNMQSYGIKPNSVTFTSLLFACCHSGLVDEGLHLFHKMESEFGVKPNTQHYGCVIDLLGKAGFLKEAYELLKCMAIKADTVLWRSLLSACNVHGDVEMGEKVGKMLIYLKLSNTCEDYVALSNVYASAQKWEDVEMVREVMKMKGIETKPGCSEL